MPSSLVVALLEGVAAGLFVAFAAFLLYNRQLKKTASGIVEVARLDAERIALEARTNAEAIKAQALAEAREDATRRLEAADAEARSVRADVERIERRLEDTRRDLDRRRSELDARERVAQQREQLVASRERVVSENAAKAEALVKERQRRLEELAGLTAADAREEIRRGVEESARGEALALARDLKEKARRDAEREGRKIIALAVQRLAAEHTAETTVSAVPLPNDELKGRIIGREGRNIRAFETATGCDLIIDDTPDTVAVSCFDPIRREVGRRALAALIADGRIHPGRIEELVAKLRKELDAELVDAGERAVYDVGVHGLHPELVKLVGRMKYRTSYGQNILEHSKEVAWLAGMMAAELKLDVNLARRGGLLHDVGKVLTHDNEGTHVELGVEVATKYGEKKPVIGCIAAHHDDVPHETVESVLVQAADAISGSRPGARRESYDTYVKRLVKLEEIANSFTGVEKSNVIQAGREVRVVVTPEKVDDLQAAALSEAIAKRIEGEMQYPGQIRVTVIRETRVQAVAR
jgi:ribonuclease Y